jgi:hypothetical protein
VKRDDTVDNAHSDVFGVYAWLPFECGQHFVLDSPICVHGCLRTFPVMIERKGNAIASAQ